MDFFVPSVADPLATEDFLKDFAYVAQDLVGAEITPGRARFVKFIDGGELQIAMVGGEFDGETVECILNSDRALMIFTINHGLGWGKPILVDKRNIQSIEWFDGHRAKL